MILHLTTVDGRIVWLNSTLIEAFGPSISVPNATWIDMVSGEEYHISESPEEVLEQMQRPKKF